MAQNVTFRFEDAAISRAIAACNTIGIVKKPNGEIVSRDGNNPATGEPWTASAWTKFVWRNMLHRRVVAIEAAAAKVQAEQGVDTTTDLATDV